MRIMRVEDAPLGELVDLAFETFPQGLPENSIILFGSGTHLLHAGSSGNAKACVEASCRLVKIAHCVQICSLVPILSGSNPGTLF